MSDYDPLDALHAAWNEVQPPAPDVDDATDALMNDLCAVWDDVDAPVVQPDELRELMRLRDRSALWRDRAVLAAAASLIFALVLGALSVDRTQRGESDQVAVNDLDGPFEQTSSEGLQSEDNGRSRDQDDRAGSVAQSSQVRYLAPEVSARSLDNGQFELRHGRVRLILGGNTITEEFEQVAEVATKAEKEPK